jgi:hypothetical protein
MSWPLGSVPKSLAAAVNLCSWVVCFFVFFFFFFFFYVFFYFVCLFVCFLIVAFSFTQFVFGFLYFNVLVGPSSPEGAQLTVRGGGFLLYRYWSLVYFVCQYVVVVYISLRDDGR